jgi:hypothetical protein
MMTAGPHYLRTVLDEYGAHCRQHCPHQARNLRPVNAGEVIAAPGHHLAAART